MIVAIGGPQGSGKSSCARALYNSYSEHHRLLKINSHNIMTLATGSKTLPDAVFLGPYKTGAIIDNQATLQGVDHIVNKSNLDMLVKSVDDHGYHVIYDHSLWALPNALRDYQNRNKLALVLDTPADTIAEQRKTRSKSKGKATPKHRFGSITPDYYQRRLVDYQQLDNTTLVMVNVNTIVDTVAQHLTTANSTAYTDAELWDLRCIYTATVRQHRADQSRSIYKNLFEER